MVQLAEELETARTTYGALHSQLVDELPTLLQLSTEVCNHHHAPSPPPAHASTPSPPSRCTTRQSTSSCSPGKCLLAGSPRSFYSWWMWVDFFVILQKKTPLIIKPESDKQSLKIVFFPLERLHGAFRFNMELCWNFQDLSQANTDKSTVLI